MSLKSLSLSRRCALMVLSAFVVAPFWNAARAEEKAAAPVDQAEWAYLDNGHLRIGVKKSSGACIGYLSTGEGARNVLNHFDQGRFVQQSYYGDSDGSMWGQNAWRYNPVQGGEYKGAPSTLLELKIDKTSLYARTTPRHWARGDLLPEVVMEEWIDLKDSVAHVRFKMTYNGTKTHSNQAQEIPAIFVDPLLANLVAYDGDKPWTGAALSKKKPGWPNESQKLVENWAAYVDDTNWGVGAYVPVATEATCYRYQGGGNSNCSYIAPITYFALTPGKVFDYDLYLTIGSTEEIRQAFTRLHQVREAKPKP